VSWVCIQTNVSVQGGRCETGCDSVLIAGVAGARQQRPYNAIVCPTAAAGIAAAELTAPDRLDSGAHLSWQLVAGARAGVLSAAHLQRLDSLWEFGSAAHHSAQPAELMYPLPTSCRYRSLRRS